MAATQHLARQSLRDGLRMTGDRTNCPHCRHANAPEKKSPTVQCTHCGGSFPNPLYRETTMERILSTPSKDGGNSREIHLAMGIILALLILGGGITWFFHGASSPVSPDAPSKSPLSTPDAGDKLAGTDAGTDTDRPETNRGAAADWQLPGKLNVYVTCLASYEEIRNGMAVYFSWRKDPLSPPHCEEKHTGRGILPIPLNRIDDCEASLAGAARMSPDLPDLHAAARAYVKSLQKAAPIFKMASAYYIKKKYTEDDCLKGRVLHPQLLKKFERITLRYNQLWQLTAAHARNELARCIEWSARQPERKPLHQLARIVDAAQKLVTTSRIQSQSVAPDLSPIRQALGALQREIDGFFEVTGPLPDTHDGELFETLTAAATEFIRTEAGHFPGHRLRGLRIRNGQPTYFKAGTLDPLMDAFHQLLLRYNDRAKNYCTMLVPCKDDNRCPER